MGLMWVLLSKTNDVLQCRLQVDFMQPVAIVCIKLTVVNLSWMLYKLKFKQTKKPGMELGDGRDSLIFL